MTRLGFGVLIALPLSGGLVVALVVLAGMSAGAALALLALLDVAIVGGGYAAIRRRSRRQSPKPSP